MSQDPTPLDVDAALQAVKAGRSLAEHMGLSDQPARLLYTAAVGHYESGQHAQAIHTLVQVTALDARMPDAWALMGNCLMREGRFAEALEAWTLALHLKPSFAAAHQVARTALALKDPATGAIGWVAMAKHASTDEQRATCGELGAALKALPAARAEPPSAA